MELIENSSRVVFDGLQVFIDGKLFGCLRYNDLQKAWILWTDNSEIGTAYHNLLCDTMDAIEQEINNTNKFICLSVKEVCKMMTPKSTD